MHCFKELKEKQDGACKISCHKRLLEYFTVLDAYCNDKKKMKCVKKLPAFIKQTKRRELRASKNQAFILGKKN